jgi:hypothetical protein
MPPIEVVFLCLFVEIFSMNEIVESLVDRLNTNLKEAFQERAAIRQYVGGQDREMAEAMAVLDVIHMCPKKACACWE